MVHMDFTITKLATYQTRAAVPLHLKSRSRIGETITMLCLAARVERSLVLMPRYVNARVPFSFKFYAAVITYYQFYFIIMTCKF